MKANIIYTSLLVNYIAIEQHNEIFNNLPDIDKRREIAWDALQLVLGGFIEAAHCEYWSRPLKQFKGDSKALQLKFNNNEFLKFNDCRCCQRGLMMLSQIRLGNSIDGDDSERDSGEFHVKVNVKGFGRKSFLNMEKDYEDNSFLTPYGRRTNEKLANICCNVIVNGDYNSEDKNDYLIHD